MESKQTISEMKNEPIRNESMQKETKREEKVELGEKTDKTTQEKKEVGNGTDKSNGETRKESSEGEKKNTEKEEDQDKKTDVSKLSEKLGELKVSKDDGKGKENSGKVPPGLEVVTPNNSAHFKILDAKKVFKDDKDYTVYWSFVQQKEFGLGNCHGVKVRTFTEACTLIRDIRKEEGWEKKTLYLLCVVTHVDHSCYISFNKDKKPKPYEGEADVIMYKRGIGKHNTKWFPKDIRKLCV